MTIQIVSRQQDISGRIMHFSLNFLFSLSSNDVTIHVCDDSRNAKKDFVCNQDILLSQMGYFRDLTAGQSLEDVDISVHCDITIFEWLMEWIKRQEDAR